MIRKYFFELSGEHPDMPAAEAYACIKASLPYDVPVPFTRGPGYAMAEFDDSVFNDAAERIALTQKMGRYLGSFDPHDTSGFGDVTIPEGTFAVRARRYECMMRDVDSQDLTRKLGKILSGKNDVSLNDPDIEVRMFMSDRVHLFICDSDIDRSSFERRKVAERPFFSPISLHPKFARASINLTRVKKGGTILDPFCGTGGIVMEAAAMGMRVIASDLDERMVTGCAENMEHYGLRLHDSDVLDIGCIGGRFENVDAVVTDPPYGRSTHTAGENAADIHKRAMGPICRSLKNKGRATVVLPYELRTDVMVNEDVFVQRVHGSLSRHYHVMRKP
ncbi:MAG: RsmD family RNA methyltransferase [Methanomassiliicoccaceae archaeon]|jgi:tRNA (guanine10-N2)-dimethyltransferase|nr:RsmD family RNA methyltransferase [Methanomassiliicoccaceae archaeon]